MSAPVGPIEADEPVRLGADRTDGELLTEMRKMVGPTGTAPSRNAVMKEFGIGTGRAVRLLGQLQTGPRLRAVTPDEPGPVHPPAKAVEATGPAPAVKQTEPSKKDRSAPQKPTVRSNTSTPDRTADQQRATGQPVPTVMVKGTPHRTDQPVPTGRPVRRWPIVLIASGAFVSIWGGWVGLGGMTGFGPVRLLPGIADRFVINTAITLPLGVETYAAVALHAWLSDRVRSVRTKRYARRSALGSLGFGLLGQAVYHLMVAAGMTVAPWPITLFVSCIPVVVLGLGAGLFHMLGNDEEK